jgi:hypothetical protein
MHWLVSCEERRDRREPMDEMNGRMRASNAVTSDGDGMWEAAAAHHAAPPYCVRHAHPASLLDGRVRCCSCKNSSPTGRAQDDFLRYAATQLLVAPHVAAEVPVPGGGARATSMKIVAIPASTPSQISPSRNYSSRPQNLDAVVFFRYDPIWFGDSRGGGLCWFVPWLYVGETVKPIWTLISIRYESGKIEANFFSGLKRKERGSRVPGGASVLLEDTFRADLLDWLGLFTGLLRCTAGPVRVCDGGNTLTDKQSESLFT